MNHKTRLAKVEVFTGMADFDHWLNGSGAGHLPDGEVFFGTEMLADIIGVNNDAVVQLCWEYDDGQCDPKLTKLLQREFRYQEPHLYLGRSEETGELLLGGTVANALIKYYGYLAPVQVRQARCACTRHFVKAMRDRPAYVSPGRG